MPANRDAAAAIGLPAAVSAHPGYDHHIEPVKPKQFINPRQAKREVSRGARLSRHARAR